MISAALRVSTVFVYVHYYYTTFMLLEPVKAVLAQWRARLPLSPLVPESIKSPFFLSPSSLHFLVSPILADSAPRGASLSIGVACHL
jgi:hypothetical protein